MSVRKNTHKKRKYDVAYALPSVVLRLSVKYAVTDEPSVADGHAAWLLFAVSGSRRLQGLPCGASLP